MTFFLHSLELPDRQPVWVTIGNFDGVHLGHQKLIEDLKREAVRARTKSCLITFHPHPKVFFGKVSSAYSLSTLSEKKQIFAGLGLDYVITLPFDRRLTETDAADFLSVLRQNFDLKGLLVGDDFSLGRNRTGNFDFIEKVLNPIPVMKEKFVEVNGTKVSSIDIRKALGEGDISLANAMLGRRYSFEGIVSEGKKVGHTLGIPTANLKLSAEKYIPKYGVYASLAHIEGQVLKAITNIGVRPTFEQAAQPNLETLILDFSDNIYKKPIKIELVAYLRSEQKFSSVDALLKQIGTDKSNAWRILENGTKS